MIFTAILLGMFYIVDRGDLIWFYHSAILSFQNIKSDCNLDMAEQNFLHEVEELHVSSGLEEDVETLISSMEEDKLTLYSQYCACHENIKSFCSKVLAKYFSDEFQHSHNFTKRRLQSSLHSLGKTKNFPTRRLTNIFYKSWRTISR